MADIKALLKEARKLVDDKKFKEAQESCKSILKQDKQNYLALVLLGKSLEETDQAPLAFQKAIATKPDNPLAWFGLANYYEKLNTAESLSKCINIYEEILNLKIESEKAVEILSKFETNCMHTKNSHAISIIVSYAKKSHDNKAKEIAQHTLFKLLQSNVVCHDENMMDCLQILMHYYEQNKNSDVEIIIAQLILQNKAIDLAVNDVLKLIFFNTNAGVRVMTCEKICNFYIENSWFNGLDIDSLVPQITAGIIESKQAQLLNSIILYDKGFYLDSYKITIKLINFNQPSVNEARFLLNCSRKLENWNIIEKLSQIFLDKIFDSNFIQELKTLLFESLVKQKKWAQAYNTVCGISIESLSLCHKAYLAECYLELETDANELLITLKDTPYYERLISLQYLKQKNYQGVINTIESTGLNDPICLLYLGIAYFELKQHEKCIYNLLKAAKIDTSNADVFLYLGHYYKGAANDLEKARKCYEKANNLRGFHNDTTKSLSEVYSTLGKVDQNFELLTKYSNSKQTVGSWIRFRLGLHYLNRRDWENAITNFRLVIKEERNNSTALECLADAYYGRGAHTSALRAYSLVMSMDPEREYHCQMRIGYINSLLTQYKEALAAFNKVLILKPHSVLAIKGMSETFIRIAKKKASAKLYGSARDSAQQAVHYLSSALIDQKEYRCLWKLMGDVLMFFTKLPDQYSFVYMNETFTQLSSDIKRNKIDIFPQAIACYSHVSKSIGEIASYDLAFAYYAFYEESQNYTHCHVSINLTTACLKRNPEGWKNWTLLGKLFFFLRKFNLSQHCFIKALLTTKKWAVAKIWCNLGSLYVDLKLNKLANYCFWRGQSTLPSYPHSWIGQGLIAEAIREEEAMDLFRHASRLGYHRESALGYADWVCRTLKSVKGDNEYNYEIEGLHAIPYAIDLMEWFLCHEADDACALTILGILQERYGLFTAALKSFDKAYKNCAIDNKNITILNMARIHLRLGIYEESIKYYKSITEASFDSACGLALALYKNGLYEESYSAYDTALHWLSNENDERADLLVAMAGIVYKFKGPDDAKTLLFHSIQVSQKKPTARSLFGICCLGLLHSDQSLSKLALSELKKYEDDKEFCFHISFLKSYILFCEGSTKEALTILSEALHEYPNNAALWYLFSQYLIKIDKANGARSSICAQKALCSANSSYVKEWEPPKALATASIAEYVTGEKKKAIKLAKVGYHVYPDNTDILAALIFTLLTYNARSNISCFLTKIIKYLKTLLKPSKIIISWINFIEKRINNVA